MTSKGKSGAKKLEKVAHQAFQGLLKNYIFSAPLEDDMKHYLHIYIQNELHAKKKFRVYADTAQYKGENISIFVDVESEAIFCARSAAYIGYIRKGTKIIVQAGTVASKLSS